MLKAIRDEADPTTSIHVNFPSLPRYIKAKAGDLISLQLMYCPGGSETFSVVARKEWFPSERLMELRKVQASNRGTNIPFLSNRLEFKLTNKMVFDMKRDRKQ